MVSTSYGCTCGATSTAPPYGQGYGGTAESTYPTSCICRLTITDTTGTVQEEEPAVSVAHPHQQLIMRTVFYITLLLEYYIKKVARGPPLIKSLDTPATPVIIPTWLILSYKSR